MSRLAGAGRFQGLGQQARAADAALAGQGGGAEQQVLLQTHRDSLHTLTDTGAALLR